jgi:hypothetical protein
MRILLDHKNLTAVVAGFLSWAVVGISIELHHCHGMGGTFSTTACQMSQRETCAMHDSTARVTSTNTCCESHTFSLTSGDPYAPSVQKILQSQTVNVAGPAPFLHYLTFGTSEFSYPLKFLSHSPPPVQRERAYLLHSSLLI